MNTLGVVGGLGPQATSDFYISVIKRVALYGQGQLPPMVVYSVPMPANLETALIRGETHIIQHHMPNLKTLLGEAAQHFVLSGITTVAMVCNTLQFFFQEICSHHGLTHLGLIESTAARCRAAGLKRVLILGTASIRQQDSYRYQLEINEIEGLYPTLEQQSLVEEFILATLHTGPSPALQSRLLATVNQAAQQCDGIVLGCTDLTGYIRSEILGLPVIDSVKVLVEASADYICSPGNFTRDLSIP